MSWATCYNGSNNIHHNDPPKMSDGRLVTHWKTPCSLDKKLMTNNNVHSNFEYRQFLMKNGPAIVNTNTMLSHAQVGVTNFDSGRPWISNKYLFKNVTDFSMPYGYEGSNLKHEYMSREALNARLTVPTSDQATLFMKPRAS